MKSKSMGVGFLAGLVIFLLWGINKFVSQYNLWRYIVPVAALWLLYFLFNKLKEYQKQKKEPTVGRYDFDEIEKQRLLTLKEKTIRAIKKSIGGELKCYRCGAPMVLRTAKRGRNRGNKFYGCSNFPKCRVIINKEEYDRYIKVFNKKNDRIKKEVK